METLAIFQAPVSKSRIGKPNDGGYVICNLPGSYDCLISGGVSDDVSFEQSFLSLQSTPIPCYAFDGTVSVLPVLDPRIQFIKKNLGAVESETTTNLVSTMEPYSDIFMKIDIEGHEFHLFPALENLLHKVKQLVVEIHSPGDISLHPAYFKGLGDIKNEHMFSMLSLINKTHTLVHVHPNNGCATYMIDSHCIPNVFECTYIRNEFIPTRIHSTDSIPTPLDMPNIREKPVQVFAGFPFIIAE
jgi:hypothetical protein